MAGKLVKAVRRGQRGMATAEYAVGSVAVATGAGTLIWLLGQDWFKDFLKVAVETMINVIVALFGG